MTFLKRLVACVGIFGLGVVFNAVRFGYGPDDAFWRTLMVPFEGTVWAPGFSEAAFSKLRLGMPSSEVTSLLGEPLRKDCGEDECFWIYTWQDTQTADFDQRWVIFDLSDRVQEVRKSFFID